MKVILCVVALRICVVGIQARVFCQDTHASSWMALGYSCPVNCDNIITAVRRLKTIDYKIMFMKKLRSLPNESNFETDSEVFLKANYNFHPPRRKFNFIHSKSLRNVDKILNDKILVSRLKFAFNMAANDSRLKCPPQVTDGGKNNMSNCRRMYDHEEFLKKFTNLLNKYTQSQYQFTEEMTSIILEKILGTNMDLRHGIFDIKRMLTYLSKAIRYHRGHSTQDFVIKLKSRHCLTISIPGCYCISGFVESSGQCVQPSDCIGNQDKDYLARIIVY